MWAVLKEESGKITSSLWSVDSVCSGIILRCMLCHVSSVDELSTFKSFMSAINEHNDVSVLKVPPAFKFQCIILSNAGQIRNRATNCSFSDVTVRCRPKCLHVN
jgi:hypothetical protein